MLSSYGIDIKLQEGSNIVRFAPEETGVVPVNCWMGMIRSKIMIAD